MTPVPYRVRVVSDLHVRSRWGLWPPDFEFDGEVYPQNKYNRFLWECWTDMLDHHPKPDLVVVNGDLDDGRQPKEQGANVKTTELDPAQQAVIEVLRPLVEGQEWLLVRGTPYHERWFNGIGNELKARRWPEGGRSGQVYEGTIQKVPFNIAHHPEGGSGVIYRGTVLDRTVLWSIISGALKNSHDARIIVRSHWHHYDLFQSNGRTIVHTPGWQLQTPRMKQHAYFRYKPEIGFVDLLIRPDEADPVVVPVKYPYPLPPLMHIGG